MWPLQLSAIQSAPTTWSWSYITESSGIRADVSYAPSISPNDLRYDAYLNHDIFSYDIWFGKAQSGTPATSASSYEMYVPLSLLRSSLPLSQGREREREKIRN